MMNTGTTRLPFTDDMAADCARAVAEVRLAERLPGRARGCVRDLNSYPLELSGPSPW